MVFEGRDLPLSVYDELKAILSYGCLGGFVGLWLDFMIEPNYLRTDVMTWKLSTFPFDNDSMQTMIGFVQRARGVLLNYCIKGKRTTDFVLRDKLWCGILRRWYWYVRVTYWTTH